MKPGELWLCPRCQQDWLERHPLQWLCCNCGFYLVVHLNKTKKEQTDDLRS